LVLANGPTLKTHKHKIDQFIKQHNPIILGANNLENLFVPHYHAFNNKKRFSKYIQAVSSTSKLLLSEHFSSPFIQEQTDRSYELLFYDDILSAHFEVNDGVIATNCRTISVLLIGIAIVMGAKRIFIAGMDGYIKGPSKNDVHFYAERDEKETKQLLDQHQWCEKFLLEINEYLTKMGKEKLVSITPTSYSGFCERVD